MARFDMSEFKWSVIQPHLPTKVRGVARLDDRRMINGILWRWRTGALWGDISERNDSHKTCYSRFVRWRQSSVWDRLMTAVSKAYDGDIQMIDSSSIRVHQHGAKGVKRGSGCMGRLPLQCSQDPRECLYGRLARIDHPAAPSATDH